jgi:altronate dehydratase
MLEALCTHPNVGAALLVSLGCEQIMAARAATPELGEILLGSVAEAARYDSVLGHKSFERVGPACHPSYA